MDDSKRDNVAPTMVGYITWIPLLFGPRRKKPAGGAARRNLARVVLILVSFFSLVFSCYGADHQSLHDVYMANTEHELHVFRIYGKKPGKTIMLIGGIQGDEPGGYLTADLYADITLQQGNLIVVPRANFYSILLNQRNGLTGDMNRKFADQEGRKKSSEQEIVTILKKLIGEADCLLNLHEGSGFFSPDWVNEMENPGRFGQSIIYDARNYTGESHQKTINLEELALRVIERVNLQIENRRYHFRPNNHNTISDTTKHKEQRKSATYYALTQANIPAFGIETSKSIKANAEKVSLQKLVVNTFMDEFGIIPETPGLHQEKTRLEYVLVKINENHPFAVPSGSKIKVRSGDQVIITDIIANFERGLAADFLEMGSYNDTQLPFRIAKPTKVVIRKDAETCGWIDIDVRQDKEGDSSGLADAATVSTQVKAEDRPGKVDQPTSKPELTVDQLLVEKLLIYVDGKLHVINEGEEIAVPRDKALVLKGVQTNISRFDSQVFANLRGFAPPKNKNDGNDFNFSVYPEQDLWKRYSENKAGIRYPIDTTYHDKEIGRFWIRLK